MKKNNKGLIIALVVVLLAVAAFAVYKLTQPTGVEKSITVQVIHKDGSAKDFALKTRKNTLGEALMEGKVVRGKNTQYGLYIDTADNETADEKKQEWWKLTKDGTDLQTGADSQKIADGEHYELNFTVGFN